MASFTLHGIPVSRGIAIGRQLPALAAIEIGVEYEAIRPMPFEQHHACRWAAIRVRRRQRGWLR